MREKLTNYIRAGYPGICLVTPEETRAEAEVKAVAEATKHSLLAWSATTGLIDTADGRALGAEDPMEAVTAVAGLADNTVVLFRDLHMFLADANPVLVRALKEALAHAKTTGKCLILLGCRCTLPPELERELVVLDFALPDKAALGQVLDGICESAKLKKPRADEREAILDAASGMTCAEAENAMALSVVQSRSVAAVAVAREKAATVKRSGLLEVVEATAGLEGMAGWTSSRRGC